MQSSSNGFFGYQGRWAWVDLTQRTVRIEPADAAVCRDYVGGRGVQARLIRDHLAGRGPLVDPLGPDNRIVIGTGPLNDTLVPTAGRGSCSAEGVMLRYTAQMLRASLARHLMEAVRPRGTWHFTHGTEECAERCQLS